MLGQRTNGSYEQDSVRSGEEVSCKTLTQTNQKSKKTDKCIVSGYRPKAGVVDQGTTNLVCRRHEFGMGHLRDPAACYLDSTLSEYRRLRPRQKRFLFFLRFSSQDFPVKRDVEKQIFQTRCRTTSPTLTTSDRYPDIWDAPFAPSNAARPEFRQKPYGGMPRDVVAAQLHPGWGGRARTRRATIVAVTRARRGARNP